MTNVCFHRCGSKLKPNIVVGRVVHAKPEWVDTDDGPFLLVPFFTLLTKFAAFAIYEDFIVCFISFGDGGKLRSRELC